MGMNSPKGLMAVLDCSALVRGFGPGDPTVEGVELLRLAMAGEARFFVPAGTVEEAAQMLSRAVRVNTLPAHEALDRWSAVSALALETLPPVDEVTAMRRAMAAGLSFNQMRSIMTAERANLPLVVCDAELEAWGIPAIPVTQFLARIDRGEFARPRSFQSIENTPTTIVSHGAVN